MLFSIPDDLLSRCIKFQPSSSTRTLFIVPQRNPCFVDDQGKKEDEIKSYPRVRIPAIRIFIVVSRHRWPLDQARSLCTHDISVVCILLRPMSWSKKGGRLFFSQALAWILVANQWWKRFFTTSFKLMLTIRTQVVWKLFSTTKLAIVKINYRIFSN